MSITIRSQRFAGSACWLGPYLVEFDASGLAVGIVREGPRVLPEPVPVTAEVVRHAEHFPDKFTIQVEDEEEAEGGEETPEVPRDAKPEVPAEGDEPPAPEKVETGEIAEQVEVLETLPAEEVSVPKPRRPRSRRKQ